MKKRQFAGLALCVVVIAGVWFITTHTRQNDTQEKQITIGIITPLSGDVAYYGEATRVGVALAKKDLATEGIAVNLIIEDGELDPKKALSAAQKLVAIDHVRAIYSEFAPAAVAVSSFLKGKPVLHIYDAAPSSPLLGNNLVFKTYIDYEESCAHMAEVLKTRGVTRVGVLEANMEFGMLCTRGITRVFGSEQTFVETYTPSDPNFRTQLQKLKSEKVEAVFNGSFAPDSLTSLAQMRELGMDALFVASIDIVYPESIASHGRVLEGTYLFGLPEVDPAFLVRLTAEHGSEISYPSGAALAYLHITQLARALSACQEDMTCTQKNLASAPRDETIGFMGYRDRIAQFEKNVRIFKNGTTEPLE